MADEFVVADLDNAPVILTLTIDNSQPIELSAFIGAFTSLATEYRKSVRVNDDFENDATIFVKQVRSGSIVADLIPLIAPALPIIAAHADQIWQAVEFVNKWADRIKQLSEGFVPTGFGRSDLKTFTDATQAIARDPNASATLEAATFEDGKRQVRAAFKFETREAKSVISTIDGEYKRLDTQSDQSANRVLMIFTRSDINNAPTDKRSGERVVVSEISDRELPLIYASELSEQRIKYEVREVDDNIFKKGFVVDIIILYKGDKPIAYKVTNVHDVIDIPDDV